MAIQRNCPSDAFKVPATTLVNLLSYYHSFFSPY